MISYLPAKPNGPESDCLLYEEGSKGVAPALLTHRAQRGGKERFENNFILLLERS